MKIKNKTIKKILKTKEPTKARIKTESAERRKMNPNNSERNKKLSQKSINKAHYTEFYTEENKKSQKHFNANQTISNDKTKPKKIKEVKKDKTVQYKPKNEKENKENKDNKDNKELKEKKEHNIKRGEKSEN